MKLYLSFSFSFVVLVMACGDDHNRHQADAPVQTADAPAIDAPPGATVGYGRVLVQGFTAPTAQTSMQSLFYTPSPYGAPVIEGPCEVTTHATGGTPMLVNAGDLTLTIGSQVLSAPAATNGQYTMPSTSSLLFAGGETVQLHATGATVPSFDASVTAPATSVITQPATQTTIQVDHTMPLSFAWTGGTGSVLLAMYDSTANVEMRCYLPAGPGSGSIPVNALAHFPVGTSATLVFANQISGTASPAGWAIDLWVFVDARFANGTSAQASLQIN